MNKVTILLLTITIYASTAEPLRNRQQRQFARQEVTTAPNDNTDEFQTTPVSSNNGPYAPSGWKPSGQLLVLPARQQQQPQQQYGPPQPQYVPPQQYGPPATEYATPTTEYGTPTTEYGTPTTEYGAPDEDNVTSTASDSTDSNEITDEPESESVDVEDGASELNVNRQSQQQPAQPGYFVQLADGSLQQILYVAPSALANAKLQARPTVQAQPLYFQQYYVPQSVSYTSQYQSW